MVSIWAPYSERNIPDRKVPKMNMPNWLVHLFGFFNGGVKQLIDDLGRTQHKH